jgi:restriction system protein
MMAASSRRQYTRRRPKKRKRDNSSTGGRWLEVGLAFLIVSAVYGAIDAIGPWTTGVVIVGVVTAIVIAVVIKSAHNEDAGLRSISLDYVDNMQGVGFENYVKVLLRHRGFAVEITKASGDLGVDLVARCQDESIAIQVKRQKGPVSRHAVSDAVAGMAHYGCRTAMVVTNSHFSQGAKELARSNRCILVDRDVLTQWIMDFQGGGGKSGLSDAR